MSTKFFKTIALFLIVGLLSLAITPTQTFAAPKQSALQSTVSCSIDPYIWNSYGYYTPHPFISGLYSLNSVIKVNCTGTINSISIQVYGACGTSIYYNGPFTSRTFTGSCTTSFVSGVSLSAYARYWNGSYNATASALISIR